MPDLKSYTRAELAAFNGENGTPAYVAYKGRVFDVTASRLWKGGQHMKRHAAGQDLTAEIAAAPHDTDVLERFPQVGILVEEAAPAVAHGELPRASTLPPLIDRFLERFPFFRRHPHPMTVHFPIVFFVFAPVFTFLYLVTGVQGFETTAVNCLGAALLFSLVVIPTGFFTWWVNYGAQRIRAVTIKIAGSVLLFVAGLGAFAWRLADPGVITVREHVNIIYVVLVFVLLPMVIVVAWYGATLTFPLRRRKKEWRRRRDPG
jgi:predicted heme/steroid binding protein/uncharacterized membrane protein